MDQHITYHPITDDLLQSYRFYIGEDQGPTVAAQHCAAVGMDDALQQRFVDLLPHFAAPGDFSFDQTHGFSLALTQGFFGPYHYIHDARLSDIAEALADYTQPWQQTIPDWDATSSAQNQLLSEYSSGVFIPHARIAQFMNDAHAVPELAQTLGTVFDANEMAILWSALQYAHDTGAGLLEAAHVIEPNVADLASSLCFSLLDNCDPTGLQLFAAASAPSSNMPPPPPAPDLSVPRHLAERPPASGGSRLPSTPTVSERLRQKRGEG